MKRTGGAWDAASVTTGTISFGPINGFQISQLIGANAVSSTSVTTMTAWKLVPGTATTQAVITLTCVSSDAGHWTAEYI